MKINEAIAYHFVGVGVTVGVRDMTNLHMRKNPLIAISESVHLRDRNVHVCSFHLCAKRIHAQPAKQNITQNAIIYFDSTREMK